MDDGRTEHRYESRSYIDASAPLRGCETFPGILRVSPCPWALVELVRRSAGHLTPDDIKRLPACPLFLAQITQALLGVSRVRQPLVALTTNPPAPNLLGTGKLAHKNISSKHAHLNAGEHAGGHERVERSQNGTALRRIGDQSRS